MSANDEQIGGDHYRKYGDLQPWAVYEKWLGRAGFIGYLRGNIFSYLVRYKDKGGVDDLNKALHDLKKLIELESEKEAARPCRTFPERSLPLRCACYEQSVSDPARECPIHSLLPHYVLSNTNGGNK